MDELSTWEKIQALAGLLFAVFWGLRLLSRRTPGNAWAQAFARAFPEPSKEHRRRFARRTNLYIGAQMMLMGFVIPLGYVALTVMMFHDFTRTGIALTAAASLLCIGLGVAAMFSNRGVRKADRSD